MDATPCAQVVVVPLAVYCTGDVTSSPLRGALTATSACAAIETARRRTIKQGMGFIEEP
jgi:hypothetical protein